LIELGLYSPGLSFILGVIMSEEVKANLPEELPPLSEGEAHQGVMQVAVKTEKGHTLTRDFGFTIEEEDGKVLAFDLLDHPELGTTVLFGHQVFALRFWDEEDLRKGLRILSTAVKKELDRRK
jgi:hypothetical protein